MHGVLHNDRVADSLSSRGAPHRAPHPELQIDQNVLTKKNCCRSKNPMQSKFCRDMEGHRSTFMYENIFKKQHILEIKHVKSY